MKVAIKVNTGGFYIEDTIVGDAFSGVVPFYADPPIPELLPEIDPEAVDEYSEEEAELEIAGYIVGVAVPQGLYRPWFDLVAWEEREEDEQTDPLEFWEEGLSAEEIEELIKPPKEPTATDLLGAELTAIKLQNIEQQTLVSSMGEQLEQAKLEGILQQQTISALGAELAATKLEVIKLKGADQE